MADSAPGIELSAGDGFAGYRIERRLGRGGMGVLYLAIETGLARHVALKLIAPEAAADEVFARRFAEESRIAASIEHPNVVPIYAAGEEAGVPFIAMRYVAGADLARRLAREGRLEPVTAVELIAQVGNGLDAIHAAGLVHRDVKPANVLLAGTAGAEHAYITDFGVARNVATESGLTQTGRFVGTLDYVAAEQISGSAVDARADVYALGCLLFKLLTGEVPFPKEGDAARLFAHLNDPPPAPSLYVPTVSMALDDVVIRAMSKSAEDRYPSAGDLGRAAQAALRGEQPTVPERTVATGAAATRTTETIAVEPTRSSTTEPAKSGVAIEEGAGTAGLATESKSSQGLGKVRTRGRWRLAFGGALLALIAIAAALALAGGDGGSPNPDASGAEAKGDAANGSGSEPQAATARQPLSAARLIAEADAVCADSQRRYLQIRDLESERSADVPYAEALVRLARTRVRELRALAPPPGLAGAYDQYVESQVRVLATDRQALAAAKRDDTAGVEAARDRRDAEKAERYDLARAVGLEQCSASR
jgi:serine/threonine protein kinase